MRKILSGACKDGDCEQFDVRTVELGCADGKCLLMLIERKTTLHTGDVADPLTRSISEQLQALRRVPSAEL